MAGPKFEFLVSENTKEDDAVKEAVFTGYDPYKFGLGQKIKKFSYGVSVKVGARVNDKLEAFIRFDRGLSKIYPDYTKTATYNRFLGIGVNYYLGETY
jgi:hypothetical protein